MAKYSISKEELVTLIAEHERRSFTAGSIGASWFCGTFSASGVLIMLIGLFATNAKFCAIGATMMAAAFIVHSYFSLNVGRSREDLAAAIIKTIATNAVAKPKANTMELREVPSKKDSNTAKQQPEAKREERPAKAASVESRKPMATPITAPSRKERTEKRKPMATPVRKRSPRRVLGVTQGTGMAVRREPTISEVTLKEPLVSQDNYDAFMNG